MTRPRRKRVWRYRSVFALSAVLLVTLSLSAGVGGATAQATSAGDNVSTTSTSSCSYYQTDSEIAREGSTAGVLRPTGPNRPDDILVLLGGFNDTEPTYNASQFEAAFFGTGTGNVTGPGTLRDYYYEATDGLINLSSGPAGVSGWYETDMHSSEITADRDNFSDVTKTGDLTPEDNSQFVRKVIEQADEDIDFSDYGDCIGVVVVYQNITFRAHASAPWGNFFKDADFTVEADGTTIAAYARVQEVHTAGGNRTGNRNTIGTPAHEIGHLYGLPDLYEENGSDDIGPWGLMASGNFGRFAGLQGSSPTHFSAWTKLRLHTDPAPYDGDDVFEERTVIARSEQPGILPAAANHTAFYRINPRDVEGCDACDGQYYLLSYRKQVGFDRGLDLWVGNNDALRISRINGPWDGNMTNDPDLIEGTNRLDRWGNASFNASTDGLATLADGSNSGVDLRNITEEYGVATFNDPPERHLDADETAVFAVAVGTTLPDGTEVNDSWAIEERVATNTATQFSVTLTATPDGYTTRIDESRGEDFVHAKIRSGGLDDGVVTEGAKLIHETNESTDYITATTYPTFPLPSNATVRVTNSWTEFAANNATVEFEMNVTAAGEDYDYGMFGAPDASHFDVEVGGVEIPAENLTVTEQATHSYAVEAEIPGDRIEKIEDYDLSVAFTDQKAGVSHTVDGSHNLLRTVLKSTVGDGTEDSPYWITDVVELQAMDADRDAHFEIHGDIDAAETEEWFGGRGFIPIGNATGGLYPLSPLDADEKEPFNGTLIGARETISNLTIDRGDQYSVGLFAMIGTPGRVENVVLADAAVTGGDRTGALAGSTLGTVDDVEIEASRIEGVAGTGGLAGVSSGVIEDSVVKGLVIGGATDTGGLVGRVYGEPDEVAVNQSYSTARVLGRYDTGGLVGYNSRSRIVESVALGDVDGEELVGGLLGYNNDGVVNRSYTRGDVYGDERIGGLVGEHQVGSRSDGGLLSRVYATGNVTATVELAGGLVATRTLAEIESSYWDAEATGQAVAVGMEDDDGSYFATNLTTDEMQGDAAKTNMSAFDFEDTWFVYDDIYPQLSWATTYRRIDHPPEAHLAANESEVDAGTPIRFDASASEDVEEWWVNDPRIVEYRWWFGDGNATRSESANVTHVYDGGGEYQVTLAVVDTDGNIDAVRKNVSVQSTDDGGDDGSGSVTPDLDPFEDTTQPYFTVPSSLMDHLRVESTVAFETSVQEVMNTSTNHSLALSAPDGSTNVTFYLQRQAINVSGDVGNLTMYLDGQEHPFVVNESAGSDDSTWLGFNVPHFSTRTVRFTAEPNSTTCIAGAVAGSDGRVGLTEIQEAIDYWAKDTAVPGTDGLTIGLSTIQSLIDAWAEDEVVSC